jgi:hypothetical protein
VKRRGFDTVCQIFILLTGCAPLDVFSDPCSRTGPEVFPVYLPDRFISSGVSAEWAIVPRMHEFAF